MQELLLKYGMTTQLDDEDFEWACQFKWGAYKSPCDHTYYVSRQAADKRLYLHRELMNAARGFVVDHADHNGLNNQRSNLRVCTHSQNMANQTARRDRTYQYKGTRKTTNGRWEAYIFRRHPQITRKYLGTFDTEEQAALAYNRAAVEWFGEFACLNNVTPRVVTIDCGRPANPPFEGLHTDVSSQATYAPESAVA